MSWGFFFSQLKENTAIFPNSKGPGPQSQKGGVRALKSANSQSASFTGFQFAVITFLSDQYGDLPKELHYSLLSFSQSNVLSGINIIDWKHEVLNEYLCRL